MTAPTTQAVQSLSKQEILSVVRSHGHEHYVRGLQCWLLEPQQIMEFAADLIAKDRQKFLADHLSAISSHEAEVGRLREALTDVCKLFPTDTDMLEAGWASAEIEAACNVYDKARAALTQGETK
jgi:hypothetical protein